MQTITINPGKYKTRNDLLLYLKKERLKKGDKVQILTTDRDMERFQAIVIVVLLVIMYVLFKQKELKNETQAFSDKILNDLFEGKDIEEIEKEIEKEYDVNIEVTQVPNEELEERKFWQSIGQKSFQKAYSDNEPDYSNATVLEPNPKYKL